MKRILSLILALAFCSYCTAFAESSTEMNTDEIFPFTPEEYEPLGYIFPEFVIAFEGLCNDIMGIEITWKEPTVINNAYTYYTACCDELTDIDILVDSDDNVLAIRTINYSGLSTEALYTGGEKLGSTLPFISTTDYFMLDGTLDVDDINTLSTIEHEITVSLSEFMVSVAESDDAVLSLFSGTTRDYPVNGRTYTYFLQSDFMDSFISGGIMSK